VPHRCYLCSTVMEKVPAHLVEKAQREGGVILCRECTVEVLSDHLETCEICRPYMKALGLEGLGQYARHYRFTRRARREGLDASQQLLLDMPVMGSA